MPKDQSKKKMVHITELPLDILNVIFVLVATSDDGARAVARAAVTCGFLFFRAFDSRVLRVVNFQHLTNSNDFTKHHHANGLLRICAASGNQAAQSVLGKALLLRDNWFWRMVWVDYQRAYCGCLEARIVLHHHSLVRTFILNATSQDLAAMRQHLVNYVIMYAGYNAALDCDIIYAIVNMCSYEARKLRVSKNGPTNVSNYVTLTFGSFNSVVVQLEPPHETLYRENVVDLFDKLFPTARG